MTPREAYDIIVRDAISIYSKEGLLEKLESGKKLVIKMGADPSRPDLVLARRPSKRLMISVHSFCESLL